MRRSVNQVGEHPERREGAVLMVCSPAGLN